MDDTAHVHPKLLKAGNPAVGLWMRAGAYAAQHLTEGTVPGVVAQLYGTAPQARKLVAAGLWHAAGHSCPRCPQPAEGDYVMHDFLVYNPTKSAVEKDRERAADRQRRAREKATERQNQTRNRSDQPRESDSFAGEGSAEKTETAPENIAFPDLFAGQEGSSQRDGVDPSRSPRPDPSRSTSFGGTNPPTPKGERAAAAALVEEWWSSYGRGTAQSRTTVRRAVEDALGNGLDASLLAAAMDRLGQTSKPITGGTLQFALSEIRRPAAGAAVIPLNPHAPRTLGRAANAAAVMAELLGQENAQ
ncbi:mucin-2 [Streptomyces sp. TRM75563]|uniref:mucin-2 n=1 Tax=Streptomyces sp. TRM75563 TaxID=2817418 RepID=UPI001F6094E6|nr:mucin-2 [Streptomyces sp. TRM75563]MCI4045448.1 mucin-2 [Streptomyces sp. TRM75563]